MNFKRGISRIWVVLSFSWLALSSAIFYNQLTAVKFDTVKEARTGTFDFIVTINKVTVPLKFKEIAVEVPPNSFLLFGAFTKSEDMNTSSKSFFDNCSSKVDGVWTDNQFVHLTYIPKDFNGEIPKCGNFQKIGTAFITLMKPDWEERFKYSLFVLLPPVIVYLMGLILFWIIRGFRSS